MASGMRILTPQAAGMIRHKLGGQLPACHRCKKPLKINAEYFSRQTRKRVYYHKACWERAALAGGKE